MLNKNLAVGLIMIAVVIFVIILEIVALKPKKRKSTRPKSKRKKKSKRGRESHNFIYWEDYLNDWIINLKEKSGYRYNNDPGCYVILIFRRKVKHNNYKHYENVYVGQSARVCNRVHNHFIGKGNGDVYADVKYGKKAYVEIYFCSKNEMNALEKELIQKYNATESYNGTSGGGTDWVEKEKRRRG